MRSIQSVFLSAALFGIFATCNAEGQTYNIKARVEAGDERNVHFVSIARVKADAPVQGQPKGAAGIVRVTHSYREKVTSADGNLPLEIVRVYTDAYTDDKLNSVKGIIKHRSFEGKTVRITRDGKVGHVTMSSGKLAAGDAEELASVLAESASAMLPSHPVSVGDTWNPPLGSLVNAPMLSGKWNSRATLMEICTLRGHRCAHIALDLSLINGGTDGASMSELTGYIYVDLDEQRTVESGADGPFVVSVVANGVPIIAEANLSFHQTYDYQKIGGKAVPHGK